MAKDLTLKDCDVTRAEMLIAEIGKVRCWLAGFEAARYVPNQISGAHSPPGADSLRQIQIILKESIVAVARGRG